MPFLTLRLFAKERLRRPGKGASVQEVYLAPFRGRDYRHKTVTLEKLESRDFASEALEMQGRELFGSD